MRWPMWNLAKPNNKNKAEEKSSAFVFLCRNPHTAYSMQYNLHEVIMMDYVMLGKRVKIRRNILDITQSSLAETIGVSTSFIGHIERGTRKLSVETLYDLCKALDTTADFLLGIE